MKYKVNDIIVRWNDEIGEIVDIKDESYIIFCQGQTWPFDETMIKGLAARLIKPIESRSEILDL